MASGYVACAGSNSVDVFDTSSNSVFASIAVGSSPAGIAITPDLTRVCVSNQNDGTVSIIDTATNTVIATVFTLAGYLSFYLSISPDGKTCWVAVSNTSTVWGIVPIDIASATAGSIIPFPSGFNFVSGCSCISYDGKTIYLPMTDNTLTPTLVQVDIATSTVTHSYVTISGSAAPEDAFSIAISPDGSTLYNAARVSGTVQVIDIASMTGVNVLPVGGHDPFILLAPSDNSAVWWSQNGDGSVGNVEPPTSTSANSYNVTGTTGELDRAIAMGPGNQTLYLAEYTGTGTGVIWVFDIATLTTTAHFGTVGHEPQTMCIGPIPPAPIPPPTPGQSVIVPPLWIPRKGRSEYSAADIMTNLLAIENWANSWAPPLFLPAKPRGRVPTKSEINQDWLAIENWAKSTAYKKGQTG